MGICGPMLDGQVTGGTSTGARGVPKLNYNTR